MNRVILTEDGKCTMFVKPEEAPENLNKETVQLKSLPQIAYETYWESVHSYFEKSDVYITPEVTWEQLGDEQKRCWELTVDAVIENQQTY